MALGWCNACDRLKPITPIGQFEGRAVDWAPVHHDIPEDSPPHHKRKDKQRCDGKVTPRVDVPTHHPDFGKLTCSSCLQTVEPDETTRQCFGSRRPIR